TAATAALRASAAARRSLEVTSEKLNRTEVNATSGAIPQASNTWDGSSEPAAQADPLEAMTPRRSSSSSTASPEIPGKQNDAGLGRRVSGSGRAAPGGEGSAEAVCICPFGVGERASAEAPRAEVVGVVTDAWAEVLGAELGISPAGASAEAPWCASAEAPEAGSAPVSTAVGTTSR